MNPKVLSKCEIEVLELISQGYLVKEVAVKLNRAFGTIETHQKRLRRKLGGGNITHAVVYAIKNGIIPMPEKFKEIHYENII